MNNEKILLRQKKRLFMEKLVIIIVMFMFVLLVGFNTVKAYNYYITAHFFEFSGANFKNDSSSRGTIEIAIKENKMYPMIEIILNGELLDHKFEENNQIAITVHDGDVIQINSSMYSDSINVEIKSMSANVNNVLDSNYIILRENICTLAIIRI